MRYRIKIQNDGQAEENDITQPIKKALDKVKTEQIDKKIQDELNNKVKGFTDFLGKYSIITLAIGTVIGQATKDVVNKLVTGVITPIITFLFSSAIPQNNLNEFIINLNGTEIKIGEFINSVVEMIFIMLIIYFVVGVVFKKEDLLNKKGKKSKAKKKTSKK
ncbi:hypothetical protein GF357_05165 [Candidatus Dojkabacteria bacterium]|nr:hypothetical protein [Candidatus Dojkabacteria bacterium]